MSDIHEGPADEPELRDFLHDAAEPVHASDELFDRVRSGAVRRRRRVRMATGALTVVAAGVCGTVVAVALPGPASTPVGAPSPSPPVSCPAAAPDPAHFPSGRSGLARMLVPGTPVSGIACVYGDAVGLLSGDQDPTVPVVASYQLAGSALHSVVAALDLPLGDTYAPCPSNAGDVVYLDFHYSQGPDVAVRFNEICTILTNGKLSGPLAKYGHMPPALEALFPKTTPLEDE